MSSYLCCDSSKEEGPVPLAFIDKVDIWIENDYLRIMVLRKSLQRFSRISILGVEGLLRASKASWKTGYSSMGL